MHNIKKDFPIFKNNPWLVFLDSTASTQKSQKVINSIKTYLENDYSNIHRWAYSLAEKSEKMYEDSKKKMAHFLGADNWREVIYSFNSTYASNMLISSIRRTGILKKWDIVLVSIVEHHANVVPWLMLKEELGIEVDYIWVNKDFSLNFSDLSTQLKNPKVKIVSMTHVSNVTWEVFDVKKVWKMIREGEENSWEKRLFIIDASQSFPHTQVDVKELQCDALFCTAHKFWANSWMWILWGKKDFLENLKPWMSWWGAISWVKKDCFLEAKIPDRFEPWTPNLSGAVSILSALEYIEDIGGYERIEQIENDLVEYFLEKIHIFNTECKRDFQDTEGKNKFILIGGINKKTRAAVFSFNIEGIHSHDIADFLAEHDICVRSGQHCAEPLMIELGITSSCRASFWIYNERGDIDTFFTVLKKCIKVYL